MKEKMKDFIKNYSFSAILALVMFYITSLICGHTFAFFLTLAGCEAIARGVEILQTEAMTEAQKRNYMRQEGLSDIWARRYGYITTLVLIGIFLQHII
jgi:hypothetical protein